MARFQAPTDVRSHRKFSSHIRLVSNPFRARTSAVGRGIRLTVRPGGRCPAWPAWRSCRGPGTSGPPGPGTPRPSAPPRHGAVVHGQDRHPAGGRLGHAEPEPLARRELDVRVHAVVDDPLGVPTHAPAGPGQVGLGRPHRGQNCFAEAKKDGKACPHRVADAQVGEQDLGQEPVLGQQFAQIPTRRPGKTCGSRGWSAATGPPGPAPGTGRRPRTGRGAVCAAGSGSGTRPPARPGRARRRPWGPLVRHRVEGVVDARGAIPSGLIIPPPWSLNTPAPNSVYARVASADANRSSQALSCGAESTVGM
jgi:hypothetical protein